VITVRLHLIAAHLFTPVPAITVVPGYTTVTDYGRDPTLFPVWLFCCPTVYATLRLPGWLQERRFGYCPGYLQLHFFFFFGYCPPFPLLAPVAHFTFGSRTAPFGSPYQRRPTPGRFATHWFPGRFTYAGWLQKTQVRVLAFGWLPFGYPTVGYGWIPGYRLLVGYTGLVVICTYYGLVGLPRIATGLTFCPGYCIFWFYARTVTVVLYTDYRV
jgi:hypothetical protein